MVFLVEIINNKHQGCLKVVVYLFKGAAKILFDKKGAVNQKRLRNTVLVRLLQTYYDNKK